MILDRVIFDIINLKVEYVVQIHVFVLGEAIRMLGG